MNNKLTVNLSPPIFLILLILKLTGSVTWSWWVITCPLWAPFLVIAGVMLVAAVLVFIAAVIKAVFS